MLGEPGSVPVTTTHYYSMSRESKGLGFRLYALASSGLGHAGSGHQYSRFRHQSPQTDVFTHQP